MGLSHSPDKVDYGESIGRNSMIRPTKVVEHGDFKRLGFRLITLWRRRKGESVVLSKQQLCFHNHKTFLCCCR